MTHANNHAIRSVYDRYFRYDHPHTLNECYNNPSYAKQNAFEYCLALHQKYNGNYNYVILGYNSMSFSFAFIGKHPENNRDIFVYITKDYDRFAYIDELETR